MIKTITDINRLGYAYKTTGVYNIQASRNISEMCFSGKDDKNGLRLQLISVPKLNSNITSLNDYCFYKCENIQTINLSGSNIQYIGVECFKDCSKIQEIEFPMSLSCLMDGAFSGCEKLKSVGFIDEEKDFIS